MHVILCEKDAFETSDSAVIEFSQYANEHTEMRPSRNTQAVIDLCMLPVRNKLCLRLVCRSFLDHPS